MPSDKFFTFLHPLPMQKLLSVVFIASMFAVNAVSAAELPGPTSGTAAMTVVAPALTAAPNPTAVTTAVMPSLGSSLGEYKTVACTTNPAFSTNNCDQCFVGGSVKVGGDLNGLFDNWTNNTSNMLIAYKDEQKLPNMVAFGSTWTSTPTDLAKFWKNSSDITWISTGSGGRMNYILQAGQKVKFIDSEMGARYVLDKTDKKDGETVGMLRYPVVSHAVDKTTGNEGAATTHYECVSYALSAPVVATPTPKPTPSPAPVPPTKEVTQTATGPTETLILILAAFFIAFGMMFSLRKRS
jgi:hypothetical protein